MKSAHVVRWSCSIVLSVLPTWSAAAASLGRVTGRVLDHVNALSLPGAPIEVEGTEIVAYTDLDGRFSLDLPPGSYRVKVTFPGFKEQVSALVVAGGGELQIDFALKGALGFEEEVTVSAETGAPDSQVAQLLERKRAGSIGEGIAADEMRRNADSDAAAAMQRVTGLSVVDGQYVYVRGLGERYSNTTLNGAILPTTEPDKRVVPLDLFPTALVASVTVVKSYLPDRPADFAGGLVEIEPINFPNQRTLSLSFSGGWNSQTTFEDVLGYDGGDLDWLGFGKSNRSLPSAIPGNKVSAAGIFGGGYAPADLERFAESFANVWEHAPGSASPDTGMSALYGNRWGRFGAVASLTFNRQTRASREQHNYFKIGASGITPQNTYSFDVASQRASLGAVLNLAYRFSGTHRFALETFYSHTGEDEARSFEGFNNDAFTHLRNARLMWSEESILSSKLSGEHFFASLASSRVDWALNVALANRDEPDLRETLYEFDGFRNSYVLADESQSGLRMFNGLDDRVLDARFDWQFVMNQGSKRPIVVKFGPQVTYRTRDFSSRRFRLIPRNTIGVDLSRNPEALFSAANIGPVFELNEETRATDAYEAEQTIQASYAMVDVPLTSRLRLVGGARVERSEQQVDTFDPFNPSASGIRSSLENTDVLPGVNLVYQVRSDMNLRAAYSHTVNRPEFRELAPFEFTDVVGGRAVVGNSRLTRALIRNVDLRWEWFPQGGSADAEVVAVSLFYKDFDDPIERVIEATSQLRTSYQNAAGAVNRGIEVEVRKAIGSRLLVGLNYTRVDSEIELLRSAGQVQTTLERPLSGQSPNLFNGMAEWRQGPWSLRLLANYFDDRIVDVGALGLPDILEDGRLGVDAVVQRRFGAVSLRLSADNLADSEVRFSQGGLDQRTYRTGRGLSFNLSYSN